MMSTQTTLSPCHVLYCLLAAARNSRPALKRSLRQAVIANAVKIGKEIAHGILVGKKAAIHTMVDVESMHLEALARVRTTRSGRTHPASGLIFSVHAPKGDQPLAMHAHRTGISAGPVTAAIRSMETIVF